MINIEHLDKTYHLKNADVHAVDDVSLHIESGSPVVRTKPVRILTGFFLFCRGYI